MSGNEYHCPKICKNTCNSLNEALRKETAAVKFYEDALEGCNQPEIKNFITEIAEARRAEILKIIQKLNEIHARGQITDGLISSFNP